MPTWRTLQALALSSGLAGAIACAGAQPALAFSEKLVIAHRGASGYLPEHTLEAKAAAYAMGADYIEQDVVLSKDGVPVVLHDIHIDTVTNVKEVFPDRVREDGRYYAIDFTLDELKQLDVSERLDAETGKPAFASRFPQGRSSFEIPTFAEEIELVQGMNASTGRRVGIYPEIKAPGWHQQEGQDISKIVLEVLREHGYVDKNDLVFLQCFDWNETRRIRNELGWQGQLVQLIGENDWEEAPNVDYEFLKSEEGIKAIAAVADGIGPWMPQIVTGIGPNGSPEFTGLVKFAHANGLEVHPYTFRADSLPEWAGSLEEALRVFLFEAGVDGVFTDHPDRAVEFLALKRAEMKRGN